MPLDPERLILLSAEVERVLPSLNPLDSEHRFASIEAVRRILGRFTATDDEIKRITRINNGLSRTAFRNLNACVPYPVPATASDAQLAEWFADERNILPEIADCRALYHRRLNGEMTYGTTGELLRWLRDHPKGATPAEVDLLASLHDEFLHTNAQTAWATLLRALAPDRAREIAKTTPDSDVCSFLLRSTPEDHALFMSRFPNWAEEEAQAEAELLDSLDDDEWP
jgi:hypothetical protein